MNKSELLKQINESGPVRRMEPGKIERINDGEIRISFSSEEPYERYWGIEILSHSADAIQMDRVANGVPWLFNHDPDKPIGRLVNWRIENGKLYADPVFGRSQFAQEMKAEIEYGILPDTSIGYMINDLEMIKKEDGKEHYLVTRWMPYEGSTVTIPADYTVGMGRKMNPVEANEPATETPQPGENRALTEQQSTEERAVIMAETITPAAPDRTEEIRNIRALEDNYGSKYPQLKDAFTKGYTGEISLSQLHAEVFKVMATESQKAPVATQIGMSPAETKRYSVARALSLIAAGKPLDGLELEANRALESVYAGRKGYVARPNQVLVPWEVQQRALNSAGATAGATLVQAGFGQFYDFKANQTVWQKIGCTVFNLPDGTLTLPRGTSAGTASWIDGTTGTVSASDPGLGSVSLDPKWASAQTPVYLNLLTKSSIDAEGWLMTNMMKRLENKFDAAMWDDSADSNAPSAIVGTSGVGSVTGASFDYADLLEFIGDVDSNNGLMGNLGFVTTPTVGALLAGRVKSASTSHGYVFDLAPITSGAQYTGAGFPVYTTANCASGYLFFGDWSTVAVGTWGAMQIIVDPYSSASSGQVTFTAISAFDFGLLYPGSISIASSVS